MSNAVLGYGRILDGLAGDTLTSPRIAHRIIATASRRYRSYHIPKRNGGLRLISQPSRKVKELQRSLCRLLLNRLPVHDAAMAYRVGRSIYDNASVHSTSRFVLKMDLMNFFPSLRWPDLATRLHEINVVLDPDDQWVLRKLIFLRSEGDEPEFLSIGAPSSPVVSNALMYPLDSAICKFCDGVGVRYTRYADDLTFSTSEADVLRVVERRVTTVIHESRSPTLRVNAGKTVHTSLKRGRRITGMVLANSGRVGVGRDVRRTIRAMTCRFKHGTLGSKETVSLRGWIAYLSAVDPLAIDWLGARYGPELIAGLLHGSDGAGVD